jgi:hypothetical protein
LAFLLRKNAKNRAIRYNLAALAAKFRSYPLRGLMAPLPANTGANSRLGCRWGLRPQSPAGRPWPPRPTKSLRRRSLKQASGDKALYLINNGRSPFLSDTAKLQVRTAHLKFNPLRFPAAPLPANNGARYFELGHPTHAAPRPANTGAGFSSWLPLGAPPPVPRWEARASQTHRKFAAPLCFMRAFSLPRPLALRRRLPANTGAGSPPPPPLGASARETLSASPQPM